MWIAASKYRCKPGFYALCEIRKMAFKKLLQERRQCNAGIHHFSFYSLDRVIEHIYAKLWPYLRPAGEFHQKPTKVSNNPNKGWKWGHKPRYALFTQEKVYEYGYPCGRDRRGATCIYKPWIPWYNRKRYEYIKVTKICGIGKNSFYWRNLWLSLGKLNL